MGKRGPLGKQEAGHQGHRLPANVGELHLVRGARMDPPAPPTGILKVTKDAWHAYWRSDVAGVATEVDVPAIRRLFRLYDQHERAMQVVRKAMAVRGSTGQIRVNPLADYAGKLEGQILRLENELGLTPMARMRLGIATGEAAMTLEEMNRMFDDAPADAGDDDDPRFLDVASRDA